MKKLLAMICMLALLAGVLTAVGPMTASADTQYTQAGYGIVSIDPIDKEGVYRTVDYTSIYNGSGNAALKAELDALMQANDPAVSVTRDANGKVTKLTYTVQTLQVDCDNDGNPDDGYFSVPLGGYGSTDSRLSTGKMDDNGDGVIDGKDGSFFTCIAVTDPQGNTVLFFSLDLINSSDFTSASVRERIAKGLIAEDASWKISTSNMYFSASHTHSSPDTGVDNTYALSTNAAQRAYDELIIQRAIQVAKTAMADRVEVAVSHGQVEATKMNAVRHYDVYESYDHYVTYNFGGDKNESESFYREASWVFGDNFGISMPSDSNVANSPVVSTSSGFVNSVKNTAIYQVANVSQSDETLYLVEMAPVSGDKDPIVMVNFRAHPKLNSTGTMNYGGDHKYANSSDYVGTLREKLANNHYRASFIQGAAGNQNTWNYIDDKILTPGVSGTAPGAAMYAEIMQYREPVASDLTAYNDTKSFFSYTNAEGTVNAQSGFTYGARLADYALKGLYSNMTALQTDAIKTNQTFFTGTAQIYSDGLKAAVADFDTKMAEYKAGTRDTAPTYPYQYLHTDNQYYNLNSSYHASAVRSRKSDTGLVDTKLEINCITLGQLAFVSAPNELYDRYNISGDRVNGNLWDTFHAAAENAGYATPVFMGYTNGSEGYIPNVAAYEYNRENNANGSVKRPASGTNYAVGMGAYEANTTKFASGSGEALIGFFQETLLNMEDVQSRPTTCPMCGEEGVVWNALSSPSQTSINGGHYYLTDDLTYYNGTNSQQKLIYGNSCIDLNGHTVQNSSTGIGRAFYVVGGQTLRLMNGTVCGRGSNENKNGGVFYLEPNTKLYLQNVDVLRETFDGQTTASGGAIYMDTGATLDVTGGSIQGGHAATYGGTIYANKNTTVTLKNTKIYGGSAGSAGGNLYVYTGANLDMDSVTMYDGTATGNGDNMCLWTPNVHIYGDTVLKGECYLGGGGATTKFSGNVQAWESADGENIKLSSGTRLTFGTLEDTAKISVTGTGFITDTTGVAYAGKQILADKGRYLDSGFESRGIFAGDRWMCECGGKAVGKHTCENVAFAPWTSATSAPNGGNYYLTCEVTVAAQTSPISTSKTLRLDLAGFDLTHQVKADAADTRIFSSDSGEVITVTDSLGGGVMRRDLSAKTDEQLAAISNWGLGACLNGSGTFRMYAGTMDGSGQTTTGGGMIAGITENSTLEIYGGTFLGVTAKYGGVIYSKGMVKLCGGSFTGGKATASGGGVIVSGSGAKLILSGDATVTGNYESDGTTENNIVASATQLTVSGTYTGTASVAVTSPAVGKVVGISDNANTIGGTLLVDNEPVYEIVTSGSDLKLATSANAVVKQTNGSDVVYYESMEDALKDYAGGEAYLTLMCDTASVTLTVPTRIDLAGCDIAEVILSGEGSLIISDSATDDFTVNDTQGYGTVPASANATCAEGYILIAGDKTVSAHRLDLTLTELSLRPSEVGFYYGSRFGGDEILKAHISEYGISLRASSAPDEAYITADTDNKTHSRYLGSSWVTGSGSTSTNSVLLKGILKEENGYAINKRNAEIPVYGVAYVILDGEMIFGQVRDFSLRQFVEIVNEQFDSLKDPKKNSISAMYGIYKVLMRNWEADQIKAYWEAKQTA